MKQSTTSSFGLKAALSLSVGLTALTVGHGLSAAAQDEAEAEAKRLDTVTITATKREQTLQEVPIAVSVVDNEVLEDAQLIDILDLQSVVPSLRVSQLERSANATFIIRGFGNGGNNIGIEPSVGVFVDGVFRARSAGSLSDFADIERVEVLRGPQSTLFGKNASAGVISFTTRRPSFDWNGSVEATFGNFDAQQYKGYISGPITDTVAFSLSGGINKRDGYAETTDGDELNDRDRYNLRGQLLWEATENTSLRLIADYDDSEENCCYVALVDPSEAGGPFTGDGIDSFAIVSQLGGEINMDPFGYTAALDFVPNGTLENSGVSLEINHDFGWAEFTSITASRSQVSRFNGDSDFIKLDLLGSNQNNWDIDTLTQEFRLNGSTDRLDWLVGAFFYDEELEKTSDVLMGADANLFVDVSTSGLTQFLEDGLGIGEFFAPGTGRRELFTQDNQSYNLFAQADYAVTDRLTATLGIGFVGDEKDVTFAGTSDEIYSLLNFEDPALAGAVGELVFGATFAGATMLDPTPANIGAVATADPAGFAAIQAAAAAATPGAISGLQGLQAFQGFTDFPNAVEDGSSSDEDVVYTARLAYDVTDNVNVYGSYATAFKASSWNLTRETSFFASDTAALFPGVAVDANGQPLEALPGNVSPGTRFSEPEEVEVFELGLKADFDRGTVAVAVFDQSIKDFQSTIFNGFGFVLSNAGEQSVQGLEVEATYRPIDPLTLSFAGTFLDPVYDSFENFNVGESLTGETPAGIHQTSLYFAGKYEFELGDNDGFIRADYQYEDDIQVVDGIPAEFASREVSLVNASAGITTPSGLEISIWGRNLTDDEYIQSAFAAVFQDGVNGYPNAPQTYGVTLRKTF
ncbi:MAG: TonB-dependent receptor [Pseudomonadota bacterium]